MCHIRLIVIFFPKYVKFGKKWKKNDFFLKNLTKIEFFFIIQRKNYHFFLKNQNFQNLFSQGKWEEKVENLGFFVKKRWVQPCQFEISEHEKNDLSVCFSKKMTFFAKIDLSVCFWKKSIFFHFFQKKFSTVGLDFFLQIQLKVQFWPSFYVFFKTFLF